VHLVVFTIEMYYDARPYELETSLYIYTFFLNTLILSSHLRPDLPSCLPRSVLSVQDLYVSRISWSAHVSPIRPPQLHTRTSTFQGFWQRTEIKLTVK